MEKQVSKKRIDEYVSEMDDSVLVFHFQNKHELKDTKHNRKVIRRMKDELAYRKLEDRIT